MSKGFLQKFGRQYWEKKPRLTVGGAESLREIDAGYIFECLVRYSDLCRERATTEGLKLYRDGQPLSSQTVLGYAPKRSDGSLEGYHRRMSARFSDYCLVCDELLQVFARKWEVLGAFVEALYRETGVPTRYAEIGLYLGNYKKTPFGVHADGCGVLTVPVIGTKKVRLWSGRYAENHPDLMESFQYASHRKASRLLVARPGDLMYWPSSAWHIAESDGSFSATWSIGLWVDKPYAEVLSEILKPLLARKLGAAARATSIPYGRKGKLPKLLERSVDAVGGLSKRELRDLFSQYWLEVSSRRGFKTKPDE